MTSAGQPFRALSLKANFSWTFVGNVVYAAAQWGMLVALAKFGTPVIVGQFSLALAITAPVILLTNLQLRAVQATDATREYPFGVYLMLRLVMTVLGLLVITGITLAGDYREETAVVILIVGLAKGVEAVSFVLYGLLQQRERMDRIAISMIVKGVVSLAALSLTVFLTGSMVWGALAMLVSWTAVLVFYDLPMGRWIIEETRNPDETPPESIVPRPDWPRLLRLGWLSLPLGIVMALISLNANIPRYFIEATSGERELGIFSAMAYLIIAGTTVVQALGQSATPRMSAYYVERDVKAFTSLTLKLAGIGAVLAVGGVLVAWVGGELLLTLLYAPEYAEQVNVFILLMVAGGLQYVSMFLGYSMTAARYFRIQTILFGAITLTTLVACALLIPGGGLVGAAWALVAASAVQLLGSAIINVYAIAQLQQKRTEYLETKAA